MAMAALFVVFVILSHHAFQISAGVPIVVSTWPFTDAVRAAWDALQQGVSAVDAVVEGCSACEYLQCDGTVGFGGSPDENGETTLDAMIMDGTTMDVGAVGALRHVNDAIKTARLVLRHTEHTFLAGDQATAFALSMGIPGPSNLSTEDSLQTWVKWKQNGCQPNFWRDSIQNCHDSIEPYSARLLNKIENSCQNYRNEIDRFHHDTIAMVAIDQQGRIAAGTSTNGATHKIPGRVGDAPMAGSGAYADDEVGACGSTGDGDVMMRFLPCYQVVESMRLGLSPVKAAEDAISRIARKSPSFVGAVVALSKDGDHGGACHGWTFQYSVRTDGMDDVTVYTVYPI